jgi:hypothetical protein
MDKVSRPLLGLLLSALAFFALWFVALKPSTSSTVTTGHSSVPFGSAIDKAHNAVSTANRASAPGNPNGAQTTSTPAVTSTLSARPAAPAATAPAASPPSATAKATNPAAAAPSASAPSPSPAVADQALSAKKVLALLFYNPAGADDRAVRQELAAVPTKGGRVVKLAVPLAELSRYGVVTNQVAVNQSPTLVLVDGRHSATTIVGFADRFEIAQRVTDALAVR